MHKQLSQDMNNLSIRFEMLSLTNSKYTGCHKNLKKGSRDPAMPFTEYFIISCEVFVMVSLCAKSELPSFKIQWVTKS